jgi:hypothetical protein
LEQGFQAIQRVLAILFLGAVTAGIDDQDAFGGHAPPGQAFETPSDIRGQGRAVSGVEPQLDRRRGLVDVLSPGAVGAYKSQRDFAAWDGDVIVNL